MTHLPPPGSVTSTGGSPPVEWYIGRDGKQYGPVTDAEFRKLVELGHLKPTDLVWRDGFAEWRPARVLIDTPPPVRSAPPPPVPPVAATPARSPHDIPRGDLPAGAAGPHGRIAARPDQARPVSQQRPVAQYDQDDDHDGDDDGAEDARTSGRIGRRVKIAAAIVFFAISLGAAGWLLLPYKDRIVRSVAVAIPSASSRIPAGDASGPSRTLAGFTVDRRQNDALLQETELFQLLKRTHADWYGQRLDEVTKAIQDGGSDAKAAEGLVQALAQLRRQHAGDVLSAPAGHLTAIATTFVTNLGLLRGVSVDACYKFISNGETAPGIIPLFQSKELSGSLQRQLYAIFSAVEHGRSTPRVYPMPRQADYTALLGELEARGWSQADMQLFSDSRALAKAPPQDVCRLVTQWFESQLSLKDSDVQLRLIADSLKPLIAG